MKLLKKIIFLLIILINFAYAEKDYPDSLNKPLNIVGKSFLLEQNNFIKYPKKDIQKLNYNNFNDIIFQNHNFYPLDLGEAGADNNFSIFGASPYSNSLSINGLNLINHLSNIYNPAIFPVEYIDKAEIFVGSNAALLSNNSNGIYMNFIEMQHNTSAPYTKFWYSQESDQTIALDGIFSQNIFKNSNFTFGFRNNSASGNYNNSSFDSWNFRAAYKLFLSDYSQFSSTFVHNNYGNHLNGGVDIESSEDPFSTLDSYVFYRDLKKRYISNSFILNYTTFLDTLNNSAFSISTSFSQNEYRINSGDDFFLNDIDSLNKYSDIVSDFSLNTKYEQKLFFFTLRTGLDMQLFALSSKFADISKTFFNFGGYALGDINIEKRISLTGGIRFDYNLDKEKIAFGGRLNYKDELINTFADFSYSEYNPSVFQGIDLDKELHTLFLLNFDLNIDNFSLESNAFYRYIATPLITNVSDIYNIDSVKTKNGNDNKIIGANIKIKQKILEDFTLEFFSSHYYSFDSKNGKYLPNFLTGSKVYYDYILKRSSLRGGINFQIIGQHSYNGYYPIKSLYYNQNIISDISINGLDAFISLRLGRAFVKVNMNNILGSGYYYVYLYPIKERNFRVSVSWSFFE